jgi:GXWXG protein
VNLTPGQRLPAGQARLRELQRGTTIEAALAFYDALEPVGLEEMIGSWQGEDLPTGNPVDGLLERFGWYGKRFDGPDHGHPLVFIARAGRCRSTRRSCRSPC